MIKWYGSNGRDLPWRKTRDPYSIFLSEIMLQQTQAHRVIPKWHSFLSLYPNWITLASAPLADLIREWVGLGYNRRIIRASKAARIILNQYQGDLPSEPELLLALPGVGNYTSSAIQCFAFNKPVPVVDVNVNRVLIRFYGLKSPQAPSRIRELAKQSLPKRHTYEWNQALMDIGASICKAKKINCTICPLRKSCRTSSAGKTSIYVSKTTRSVYKGSNRYFRGQILNQLKIHTKNKKVSLDHLSTTIGQNNPGKNIVQIKRALQGLQQDELVDLYPNRNEPTHASLPKRH